VPYQRPGRERPPEPAPYRLLFFVTLAPGGLPEVIPPQPTPSLARARWTAPGTPSV